MPLSVRVSGSQDRTAILALMDSARGDGLSEAQRARSGFVQGSMTEEILARFQAETGVFVAEEDGELAGFAMTSLPGAVEGGPPKLAIDVLAESGANPATMFLYGPAVVDPRFQGRGVLRMLLVVISDKLGGRFEQGVAFVEIANAKSLQVHRHYGMTEAAHFHNREHEYAVFTFDPTSFDSRAR